MESQLDKNCGGNGLTKVGKYESYVVGKAD